MAYQYGKQVVEDLSARLTERDGKGFSSTNLKCFRLFYQAYPDRIGPIRHPAGDELPQGFSKYTLCLPTEEQFRLEIEKERRLIEADLADRC